MTTARPDTWMPMFWGDYLRDTGHLDALQHGAYLLLIGHYWTTGKPLPDDDKQLSRIARLTLAQWRKVRAIIGAFFEITDGMWRHGRVEAELTKALNRLETKRRAGAVGGRRKWGEAASGDAAAATRSQRLAAARQIATHTEEEWNAMVTIHGGLCVRCGNQGPLCKDHIRPIYQGGSDGIQNLQPLCRTCNTSKGPEHKDHRRSDWEKCLAERLARAKQMPASSPSPSPSQEPLSESSLSSNTTKILDSDSCDLRITTRRLGSVDYRRPENRNAYADREVAKVLAERTNESAAWLTVFAARDPTDPDHERARRECEQIARTIPVVWNAESKGAA